MRVPTSPPSRRGHWFRRAALVVATLLTGTFLAFGVSATRAQTFSGRGTAVLGSSMTPEGTKQLAFEKARQDALKKFGTHVVSEEKLKSIETPEGIREVSKERIVALAAGKTQLVAGSRQTKKTVSGKAIVYEVRADFKIESSGIEEALRAYLKRGDDSPLGRSVSDAVRLQEQVTDLNVKNSDAETVRRLLANTEEAYKQVSVAIEGLDGESVESELAKQRKKRKTALLRYMRTVKRHGYPRTLVEHSISRSEIQDNGDEITFTYKADAAFTKNVQKISAACKQTRPIWAPDNSRDNGVVGRPATDGWLKQVFEGSYLDFKVERPILMYMLDGSGDVLLLISTSSSTMTFNYGHCDTNNLISARLWEEEWEFSVPTRYLGRISSVVLAVSKSDYREIAKRNGFRAVENGIYGRGQGRAVPVDRFLYSRKAFRDFVNGYAKKVQSLSLTGYDKKTDQSSSINDFFDH